MKIWFKGEAKQETDLLIRKIKMNLQMEAKLASSIVEEGNQLNFYCTRQNSHVYIQKLFCIALSYLQLIQ